MEQLHIVLLILPFGALMGAVVWLGSYTLIK
jgi:hypothetical protein